MFNKKKNIDGEPALIGAADSSDISIEELLDKREASALTDKPKSRSRSYQRVAMAVAPIVMYALAVFLMFCLIAPSASGRFGQWLCYLLRGSFALGAYTIPVLLALGAYGFKHDLTASKRVARLIISILFVFVFSIICYAISGSRVYDTGVFYSDGISVRGGGLLGSVIAYGLMKSIGAFGTTLLCVAVIVLYAVLFLRTGIAKCWTACRTGLLRFLSYAKSKRASAIESYSRQMEEERLARQEEEALEQARKRAAMQEAQPTAPQALGGLQYPKLFSMDDDTLLEDNLPRSVSDTRMAKELKRPRLAFGGGRIQLDDDDDEDTSSAAIADDDFDISEIDEIISPTKLPFHKRMGKRKESGIENRSVASDIQSIDDFASITEYSEGASSGSADAKITDESFYSADRYHVSGKTELDSATAVFTAYGTEDASESTPVIPASISAFFDDDEDGADVSAVADTVIEREPIDVAPKSRIDVAPKPHIDVAPKSASAMPDSISSLYDDEEEEQNEDADYSEDELDGSDSESQESYDDCEDYEDYEEISFSNASEEKEEEEDDDEDFYTTTAKAPFDLEALRAAERREDELAVKKSRTQPHGFREYVFPPIELLTRSLPPVNDTSNDELRRNTDIIEETFKNLKLPAKVVNITKAARVTRYELRTDPTINVKKYQGALDNIQMNLQVNDSIQMETPIPGKNTIGVEVPNAKATMIYLRDLLDTEAFRTSSKTTVCVGQDITGNMIYGDIATMPHVIIAGATGMGKSVCINIMICSLLFKASPDEVKLILIDPKKVEFAPYQGIPHLLVPVVSDKKKAAGALTWAVNEMERRYDLMENLGVKDLAHYNAKIKNLSGGEVLPTLIIIIDELADLMMMARDLIEDSIVRLTQKARAAGMHIIIGTQRPSVNVVTGLIKANVPSRIAFRVTSNVDSRTILDSFSFGAEKLLAHGDMIYNHVKNTMPKRLQGAFISEEEVEAVVTYIKDNNYAGKYNEDVWDEIEREAVKCEQMSSKSSPLAASSDAPEADKNSLASMLKDDTFRRAVELAVNQGEISASKIVTKISVGFNRASRFISFMEEFGIIGEPNGQKPRKTLIDREQFLEMLSSVDES